MRGDQLAYRFLDFSTERDGVAPDLNWAEFSARNKAVAARLQQGHPARGPGRHPLPAEPGLPGGVLRALYGGRIAVPLFDPSEPSHVDRLHAVIDDYKPSAILTTTEAAEGVRKFFRSKPARTAHVIAVDAIPDGAPLLVTDGRRTTIAT